MFEDNGTSGRNQNISRGEKRILEPDALSDQKPTKKVPRLHVQENSVSKEFSDKRKEYERDESVLSRRQKQIDFGKNTVAYDRYRSSVPLDKRTREDPKTPPKHLQMNRRAFDGLVKNWKIKLHKWDEQNSTDVNNTS